MKKKVAFILVLSFFLTSCSKLKDASPDPEKGIEVIRMRDIAEVQIKNLYADWWDGAYERGHYIYDEVPEDILNQASEKEAVGVGDMYSVTIKPEDIGVSGNGRLNIDFFFK